MDRKESELFNKTKNEARDSQALTRSSTILSHTPHYLILISLTRVRISMKNKKADFCLKKSANLMCEL